MAFFTDISKIGQSTEPDTHGKLVVFDPAIFGRTKGQLSDYDANRNEWNDIYGKFKNDWMTGQGQAENDAKQEGSFLDRFYNGDFASHLAGLRAQEANARRAAGDRALQYAQGNSDRAALLRGDPSGGGSAGRAMALRQARDIENEIALSGINRERGDLATVTSAQQQNLGNRTALLDQVTKRQLLPHQLNDAELLHSIQALAGIQKTRMGAASPVFWRQTGIGEQLAAPLDDVLGAYGMGKPPGQTEGVPNYNPTMYQSQPSNITSSQPYTSGMSYANPSPGGGTTFNDSNIVPRLNYSTPSVTATGGYPISVNPYSSGFAGGQVTPDWKNYGSLSY